MVPEGSNIRPGEGAVNEITAAGTIRFRPRLPFVAKRLRHLPVGLEEPDHGIRSIYFNRALLARSDEREYILHD
jgi:hypothetical protein